MKIKIKHDKLGEIVINDNLPNEVNDIIGTDNSNLISLPFYFAKITKDENDRFTIKNLRVIKFKDVNVGWKNLKNGGRDYISIIHNISLLDELIVYPNGVIYCES